MPIANNIKFWVTVQNTSKAYFIKDILLFIFTY